MADKKMYCTIKFNIYPNVIMNDPLLDAPQVHQAASTIHPLYSKIASNDPKVLASTVDAIEINENIKNANECWDWVISKYPQYFVGMEAKVYEADSPDKVYYKQTMPFDVYDDTPWYYKNDDAKAVVSLSTTTPCWCSEIDRYDWVRTRIASKDFVTKKIGPYVKTKDVSITRVDMVATEPKHNSYIKFLEVDEYLEKNGYYKCSKGEYETALNNGYKVRTDAGIYSQMKDEESKRELDEIPKQVDYGHSESSFGEDILFGKDEDDKIFGEDF